MFTCVELELSVIVAVVVPVVAELNVGVGVGLLNKMDVLADFKEKEALDDESMDKS